MKTLIAVLIGSTMALSFAAEAQSCRSIATEVVNQYTYVAGFKVETPAQKSAFNGLVATQVTLCENGKAMRMRGASPQDAASTIILAAAKNADTGGTKTIGGMNTTAMSHISFSYGYSFGE